MRLRDTPSFPLVGGLFLAAALVSAVPAPARADLSGFFDRIGRNTNALLESIASKEDAAFIERVVERTLAQRQPIGRTAEWKNPHTGHKGAITILGYFEKGTGDPCWTYHRTHRDGNETSAYSGTACRELDSGSRSVDDGLRFRRETWIAQTRTVAAPAPAPAAPMKPPATTVRRAQELLVKAGFNPGPVDGLMGRRTGSAIRSYQRSRALAVDGRASPALVARLENDVATRAALAAPAPPGPVSVPAERQPLVLTIDGVDPEAPRRRGAAGGDDGDGAASEVRSLRPAIVADWKLTPEDNVHHVAWNGNHAGTPAAVARVKGMMEAVAQLARLRQRPFVVVAHGRGSALAYRAIRELGESGRLKPGDIRVLVTLGAPEGLGREGAAPVKGLVDAWRNYWIAEDALARPIEGLAGAENVRADFDPARDGGDAHNAYHTNPRIWRRIGNDVAQLASSS
jgi:peptidoglycan hydrolase-like protein with peptidoglycan-binding domain